MKSGLDPQMSNTSHGSEDESLMEMGSGSFGSHITEGDARSEHLVVMRYLIAGIAIMNPSPCPALPVDPTVGFQDPGPEETEMTKECVAVGNS